MAARSLTSVVGVLLFLPLLVTQEAWALQRFDQEPQYTEVNPTEDALLVCKVFNKKGSCSWQKDNKPVGLYVRKYEWAGNRENGDCSLWIRSATLDFDDGEWECQVTASDFTTQDALTSMPIRLVVRVPPQRPRIEYNTSQVLPGHNVTAQNGERTTIKCVSRYGNPPARLKWFLGEAELTAGTNQSNTTELDNPRTWVAVSILEITLTKAHHNQNLRCVALHESYDTKSQSIEVRLNVRYAPEVRLVGVPNQDLEEGRDDAVLRCAADANPPATIVWRRAGRSDIASLEESLAFRPVTRRDSGTFTCQAKNIVGSSELLSVQLDVKYPPHITSVGPDRLITAPLFSHTIFNCTGDGNPKPTFQWLQKVPIPPPDGTVVLRSNEATFPISNVTYDFQGDYVCKAMNVIGGKERAVQSEPISVQVVGAPQVLRQTGGPEVAVSKGQDALLQMVVCADPRPRRVSWEWGSLKLEAGKDQGKYKADELDQDEREDCYQARLHVRQVDTEDERNYYLAVENDRGEDRHAIHLAVTEPLSVATLVSVAAAGLLACLLVLCIVVYIVRKEKCCFSRKSTRRGDFQPTDLESEKSDVDSSIGRRGTSLHGALPAEAMYNSSRPHIITSSPEAMKRHQSAGYNRDNVYADLQLPAISNNGSTMNKTKTRTGKGNRTQQVSDSFFNSPQRTNVYYMTGNFQPNSLERAEI